MLIVMFSQCKFIAVAAGAKNFFGGGANKLKVWAIWSKLLDHFFFFIRTPCERVFVKIKPNFLSSRDIALASTLISTCLSTDESLRTVQSHEAKHIKTILIRSNNKSGRVRGAEPASLLFIQILMSDRKF